MIHLIENNIEHNYKIYKSDVIVNNHKEMIETLNKAHNVLMNAYGHLGLSSTWLYGTYNIFSLIGSNNNFHDLFKDLIEIIKLNVPKENRYWFQSWLNKHKKNEVLDWHNHEWFMHGYISIDPKTTQTVFENYSIKNEIGNIYIGPGYKFHKVEVLESYDGDRITLGFDIKKDQCDPNELISLIPIV